MWRPLRPRQARNPARLPVHDARKYMTMRISAVSHTGRRSRNDR